MKNDLPLALGFDDVLIVPAYSRVKTRKLIDIKTSFSRNIKLNIPLVSANMDTVTEAKMAIAMAREGGLGVIHRFMAVDQQAREVERVKRAETLVIVEPITTTKETPIKNVLNLMDKEGVSGILVTSKDGKLEGIVTARDVRFVSDLSKPVKEIMTPKSKLITTPSGTKKEDAIGLLQKHKLEKIPLVDKEGVLEGLITAADFAKTSKYRRSAKDSRGRLLVAAAIGVKDGEKRAAKLIKAGADALVIDIAHGHHQVVARLLKSLRKQYGDKIDLVAGNVATKEGTGDLIRAGADAIKVGIGPGRACSTRVVAGAGVPQFTAVRECARIANRHQIPVIADGGIRNSGDLSKIIGAGASTAMIGNLLAGTIESPGDYFMDEGMAFKAYRGLASLDASLDRAGLEGKSYRQERAAEGISTRIPFKGEAAIVVKMLLDGLQSGMSYSGANNIKRFWQNVKFIRITEAGLHEGKPKL